MHGGQQEMLNLAAPTSIAQSRTEPAESPNFLAATKGGNEKVGLQEVIFALSSDSGRIT
jgi:hypothetical protein